MGQLECVMGQLEDYMGQLEDHMGQLEDHKRQLDAKMGQFLRVISTQIREKLKLKYAKLWLKRADLKLK